MEIIKDNLNNFLVEVFNDILRIEEDSLAQGEFKNISVREMHVIEAVVKMGENNTAKKIATELGITQGSLTTAVATLEKKGMLTRKSGEKDKRVVKIETTELGIKAYKQHLKFHEELVNAVSEGLTEQEMHIFLKGLSSLREFFTSKK